MQNQRPILLSLIVFLLCSLPSLAEEPIQFNLLQLNDVYEIMPLSTEDGSEGGLARVATVFKELKRENLATYSLLAGDLLSPSALGLAPVEIDGTTQKLSGKQMIAVLNAVGLDWIAFGNHEFDLEEAFLLARLQESRSSWISSNVFWVKEGQQTAFPGVQTNKLVVIGKGQRTLKLGIFSVTLNSTIRPYVAYNPDYTRVAQEQVAALKAQGADVILAITHLALEDDIKLAQNVPGLDLILGGHEHENIQIRRGSEMVPILKADANARTVFIHRLAWWPKQHKVEINSELRRITQTIKEDPAVKKEAQHWEDLAFAAFRASGFDPREPVTTTSEDLDGREAMVRNTSTKMTQLLADSMAHAFNLQLALFNSGSIRIDDVLSAGQKIDNYDILRILPFGGKVYPVNLTGAELKKVLEASKSRLGTGGFLQSTGLEQSAKGYLVAGQPLDESATYQVVLNDYLAKGKESGLEFLGNLPALNGVTPLDWRTCVHAELMRVFPPK